MQLRLTIEYLTRWGDEVRVCGSIPELGGGAEERAVALHTADGKRWTLQLDFCPPRETYIEYRYLVFRSGAVVRREWGNYPRILRLHSADFRLFLRVLKAEALQRAFHREELSLPWPLPRDRRDGNLSEDEERLVGLP